MRISVVKRYTTLALLAIAVLFPLVVQREYFIYVMTLGYIWAISVYGMNLLAGYTGQLSLAHAGFFAIGAYATGILTVKVNVPFWPALLLGCIITAIIGFFIGLISLRTKEHYFAIFTLCVGFILFLIIERWDELTEGVRGLIGIPYPEAIGPIAFESLTSQYYLVLFFLVLTIFVIYRIVNSLVGRSFIAIRNSEELAQTIGIHLMKNKLLSFVISTFFAGLAGGLYASFVRFLGPGIGHITVTFDMLTYLLVGGIGSMAGPLIGTLLITWITQSLQFLQDYRMIIFGPILVLLIIYMPYGIVGAARTLWAKYKLRKAMQPDMKAPKVKESLHQVEEGSQS